MYNKDRFSNDISPQVAWNQQTTSGKLEGKVALSRWWLFQVKAEYSLSLDSIVKISTGSLF